jgi:drug/metabolite transporter (DMT)-like permease
MKDVIDDIEPFFFIILRFSLALFFFILIFNKRIKINKSVIVLGFILGIFYTIGFQLQIVGLKYTSASKSAFITGLAVIFTPIFQMLIERRLLSIWQIIGVLLTCVGLFVITNPGAGDINYGDILTVFSALSYGIYIVFIGRFALRTDVNGLVVMQFLTTVMFSFPFALYYSNSNFEFEFTTKLILTLLYLSILATIVCTYLHTKYQRETTPTKAAIIFSFEPIFAVIIASLFYSEEITLKLVIGGGLIMSGLLFSELSDFFIGIFFKKKYN